MEMQSAITATAADRPTAARSKQPAGGALSSDFETFLKLLTSQMRNQDPLKPMDSTEFVAQLADFSSVEQQVRTNETLSEILGALGGGASDLAGWIGREVRAATVARYEEKPLTVTFPPGADTDAATMIVRGANGAEIARVKLDPAAERFVWPAEGVDAEPGLYRFEQMRTSSSGETRVVEGRVLATVEEVRLSTAGAALLLDNGETIPVSAVEAIR